MRGMERAFKGVVLIAGLLGLAGVASAQVDPRVPVTFNQQVPFDNCATGTVCSSGGQVSQSRTYKSQTFQSRVQYKLTIQNKTTNSLNRAFAKLTVMNGNGGTPASIDSVIVSSGQTCTPTASLNSSVNDTAVCQLGDLAPGSAQVAVYFIVNVPFDGTQLLASWQGGGYEGNGGNNGCCQPTGQYTTQMIDKTVDLSYRYKLETFVKKEGTQATPLFTGDGAVPVPPTRGSTGDINTTLVNVPKIADTYGTNGAQIEQFLGTIVESQPTCTSIVFKQNTCYQSQLTIQKADFSKGGTVNWFSVDSDFPGQLAGAPDELLDIVLRVDSSAFKGGAKIEDVKVRYLDDSTTAVKKDLLPCPAPTPNDGTPNMRSDLLVGTLLLSANSLPCYTSKFFYPSNAGDLKNDLEVRGKNYKNGGWYVE